MTAADATKPASLDDVFAPANRSDAPGLVVGIAHRGDTIYRRAFGLASVELGVANTVATRMRIGSTTKHFTCLAALLLAEDGLLDVDAGVRTYVRELPELASEPTLRQLMSHTGGIRDYLDLAFLASGLAIRPLGSALAMQRRQRDVNFPPGERMIYCNGGYQLLSIVIARASGKPFEEFVKERLFDPLGMIDTQSCPSDLEFHARQAAQHVPLSAGGYRRGVLPTEEIRGEGAIVSTVDDMLRWLAHLRAPQKKVGAETTWRQLLEPARLTNGRTQPYCLGLMRSNYRGLETVHHGGTVIGGRCQMLTVPAHELDIIIMTNGAPLAPGDLAHRAIDVLLASEGLEPVAVRPAASDYTPLLGARYHAPARRFVVEFAEAAEKNLGMRVLNTDPVPLRGGGNEVRIDFEDLVVGPIEVDLALHAAPAQAQPPEAIALRDAGTLETFARLPDSPPPAYATLATATGLYACDDLGENAHIAIDGEIVTVHIGGAFGTTVVLEAFSPDVFGFSSRDETSPLRGVLTIDRTDGDVSGFRIDMLRTRGLCFERTR